MGNTADKLQKILRSKQEIKAAIEANGIANVGDVLADYPAKIHEMAKVIVIPDGLKLGFTSVQEIPDIKTGNVQDFSNMFQECVKLTTIPALDTSKGTNFNSMFYKCYELTTIPALDTSKGTDFKSMFYQCTKLKTIPVLNTQNGISFLSMFSGCSNLIVAPAINTGQGTDFGSMFQNCGRLTIVPVLDTGNGTKFGSMFYGCISLTTIRGIDVGKGTTFSTSMFQNCNSLVFALIKNIGAVSIGSLLSGLSKWGDGSEENRQSLVDSLITYSFDRVTAGLSSTTLSLHANVKARLTDEEKAAITAKGFTIA